MDNFFGDRLKTERERLGLNQDEMAAAGGVGKRTYCYYEANERDPDAAFLAALGFAGADILYILSGHHYGRLEQLPAAYEISPALRSFIAQIVAWVEARRLQDDDIGVLAGIASRLASPETSLAIEGGIEAAVAPEKLPVRRSSVIVGGMPPKRRPGPTVTGQDQQSTKKKGSKSE